MRLRKPRLVATAFAIVWLWGTVVPAHESDGDVRAFPEADGAGRHARGGRGGKVLFVTNLNDSGPGSLRAAVETTGARTVLFRVAGYIELERPIRVSHPFLTIAGQSAPGEGVCLKNFGLEIGPTHDVVVRYVRCRPGDRTSGPGEVDAVTVFDSHDVVIDHCTATWSTDECLSVSRDCDRVTVQWCLIAEGLTSHSMGSIIGAYDGKVSYHHNLYANNRSRNPRVSAHTYEPGREDDPGPIVDFRNNVIFNWAAAGGYAGGSDPGMTERTRINYVGNLLVPGPDTRRDARHRAFQINPSAKAEVYFSGNRVDDDSRGPRRDVSLLVNKGGRLTRLEAPIPGTWPPAEKAQEVYRPVWKEVGAVLPARDAIDDRILEGVRTRSGRIVASQADVGGWIPLQSEQPAPDRDRDGMPDAWETAHHLDPTSDVDQNGDRDGDGYLNLEEFLNGTDP